MNTPGMTPERFHQLLWYSRPVGVGAQDAGIAARWALGPALGNRIDQMQRRVRAIGGGAQEVGVAAWRALGPALGNRIGLVQRQARAIGVAARQAPADGLVIACAAVIAVGIAGWLLVPPGRSPPPEVARSSEIETQLPIAGAPAIVRPPDPPPVIAAAPALEGSASDAAIAPMAAALKPGSQAPALVARLKPTASARATTSVAPQATVPLNATPPARQPQQTTTETPDRADPHAIESMFGRMLGDGLGPSLSRRRARS
jgi:hypothetical protein